MVMPLGSNQVLVKFIGDTTNLAAAIVQAETKLGAFAKQMSAVGATISNIGLKMSMFATLPILGLGAASLKTAMDFEKAMRFVNTIAKTTGDEYEAMCDRVRILSTTVPQSAETLAMGMYDIMSAGFTKWEDALHLAQVAARMATAGLTGADVAAKALTMTINSYSMSVDKAGYVADVLFRGVERGVFTFEELADTLGIVVGASAQAGVSIEELMAALETATKAGLDVNKAATGMQYVIMNMIRRTPKQQEAIDKLSQIAGVDLTRSFSAAGLQIKGFGGVLQDLVDALNKAGIGLEQFENMTEEQYLAMAQMSDGTGSAAEALTRLFPSVLSMRVVFALLRGDLATFNEDLKETQNATGSMASAFNEAMQSTSQRWEILKNRIKSAMIVFGNKLLPILEKVMDVIGKWADQLAALPEETVELIIKILATVAALGPLVLITGKAVNAFGALLAILTSVAGAFGPVTTAAKALTIAIAAPKIQAVGGLGGLGANILQMFQAPMYGGVIYQLQTAVGAMQARLAQPFTAPMYGGLIYKIREARDSIVETIARIYRAPFSLTGIGNALSSFADNVGTFVRSNLLGGIGRALSAIRGVSFNGILAAAQSIGAGVANAIRNGLSTGISTLSSLAGRLLTVVRSAVGDLVARIGTSLSSLAAGGLAGIVEGARDLGGRIAGGITSGITGALSTMKSIDIGSLVGGFTNMAGSLAKFGAIGLGVLGPLGLLAGLMYNARDAGGGLAGMFQQILKDLKPVIDAVKEVLPVLITAIRPILQLAGQFAETLMPIIIEGLQWLIDVISRILVAIGPLLAALFQFMTDLFPVLMPVLQTIGDLVVRIIEILAPFIASLLPPLAQIIGVIATVLDAVLKAIMPILEAVLPPILSLISEVVSVLAPVIEELVPVLVPLIQQIAGLLLMVVNTILPPVVGFLKLILPLLIRVVGKVLGALIEAIGAIVEAMTPLLEMIFTLFGDLLDALLPVLADLIEAILIPIADLLVDLMPLITGLIQIALVPLMAIMKVLDPILRGFIWIIEQLTRGLSYLIEHIFGPVLDAIGAVTGGIGDAMGAIASWLPFSPAERGPMSRPVGWKEYLTEGIAGAVGAAEKGLSLFDISQLVDRIVSLKDLQIDWYQIFAGLGDVLVQLEKMLLAFATNFRAAITESFDMVPALETMVSKLAGTEWAVGQVPVGAVAIPTGISKTGTELAGPLNRIAIVATDEATYAYLEKHLRTYRDMEDKRRGQ